MSRARGGHGQRWLLSHRPRQQAGRNRPLLPTDRAAGGGRGVGPIRSHPARIEVARTALAPAPRPGAFWVALDANLPPGVRGNTAFYAGFRPIGANSGRCKWMQRLPSIGIISTLSLPKSTRPERYRLPQLDGGRKSPREGVTQVRQPGHPPSRIYAGLDPNAFPSQPGSWRTSNKYHKKTRLVRPGLC